EGVWSYDEVTGEISFDPEDGFTGDPTVITYNVSDDDGNQIATPANITIEYLDTAPTATEDEDLDNAIGSVVVI
ncbi:hypothetical protein, partial [uncultured Tenacibaculum sp.]|uniref:hypothetical protein n=1 Tax=uncultured Tenacibaculum sp. TaxID=174713 RepID=UPI002603AAA2